MRYVLGVDGGATKTMAAVGDESGQILGVGISGPTNYQLVGLDKAMKHLDGSVKVALGQAGLDIEDLEFAVFGLAGADFPVDFENLTSGISKLYPGLKYELTNDTWVGFRAGTEKDYGGVVVAGTGANFAAQAPSGKKVTGRGMGYEWGGEGGAGSLIRQAFHFAFRSHDGTGPKTLLENVVLSLLDFPSYDALSLYMYQVHGQFGQIYMKAARIVPAIFELATKGDRVAQDILAGSGEVMGQIIGGMMESLGMRETPCDVVMAGSIFTKGQNPLLIDHFKASVHRFLPFASFRVPDLEPCGGGYLLALEKVGVDTKDEVRKKAVATFPEVKLPEEIS